MRRTAEGKYMSWVCSKDNRTQEGGVQGAEDGQRGGQGPAPEVHTQEGKQRTGLSALLKETHSACSVGLDCAGRAHSERRTSLPGESMAGSSQHLSLCGVANQRVPGLSKCLWNPISSHLHSASTSLPSRHPLHGAKEHSRWQ